MAENRWVKASANPVFDRFPWWDEHDVLTQITPQRYSYISSVSGKLHGQVVLDLGCGGGLLTEPLRRAGATVIGIDISALALQTAQHHARLGNLEIEYLQAPAEELPFKDAAFDVVVAFDVLDHVASLPLTISEVARVLRPGGRFIYDTMNRTLLCRVVVIWFGENLWPGGPPKGTHDWRKFVRPETLTALLAKNGIANVETKGFLPRGIDRRGRLMMGTCWFRGLSYVGYGVRSYERDERYSRRDAFAPL